MILCFQDNISSWLVREGKKEKKITLMETKKEWANEGREKPGGIGIKNAKGKETMVMGHILLLSKC